VNLAQATKHLRPGDPILALLLIALAVWGWLGPGKSGEVSDGAVVRITSADTVRAVAVPDRGRVIKVAGPLGETLVELKDGRVRITESPCPHRFCIRTGAIDRPGAPIVCVPNGVLVEWLGGVAEVDGTTR
jgi:hypothetical protein